MNDIKNIQLSYDELSFLLKNLSLPPSLEGRLIATLNRFNISNDDADELRELCADKLQIYGFDENYEPTAIGKKLESLIDKLFVG